MKTMTTVLPAVVLLGCFGNTLHTADQQQHQLAYRSAGSLPIAAPAGGAYPTHQGTPPGLPSPLYPLLGSATGDSSSDGPVAPRPGSYTPPPGYAGIYPYPPQAGPYGAYSFPPQAGGPGYGWGLGHPSYPSVAAHSSFQSAQAHEYLTARPDSADPTQALTVYLASTAIPLETAPGELLQALQLLQGRRKAAFEKFLELDTATMSGIKAALQTYVPANLDSGGSPAGRRKSFAAYLPSALGGSKEQRAQQALQAQLDAASAHCQSFVDLTTAAGARYTRINDTAQAGLLALTGAAASGTGEKGSS